MSEDVTAQIRTGLGVILAGALVMIIVNLAAIAGRIINDGQDTLLSGVVEVGKQEFNKYNQGKQSGQEVKTALTLYEGRDIAIVVRNRACIKGQAGGAWAWAYGTLVEGATLDAGNDSGVVYKHTRALQKSAGNAFYTANIKFESGSPMCSENIKGTTQNGDTEYILDSARFRSEWIKDSNDEIVGIMFTQTTGVD